MRIVTLIVAFGAAIALSAPVKAIAVPTHGLAVLDNAIPPAFLPTRTPARGSCFVTNVRKCGRSGCRWVRAVRCR